MLARYDAYWADFLGIDIADWATSGISFRAHVALRGYQGLWCFRRHDRIVVSAPAPWLSRLEARFSTWTSERFVDPQALSDALGAACLRVIGPAFQGCVSPAGTSESDVLQARPIELVDPAAVRRFREACPDDAWSTAGMNDAQRWQHAFVDHDGVSAIAGLRIRTDEVGDVGVVTRPDARRRGRGATVVRAVVARALEAGTLPLYQTLVSNVAAVRLALAAGFESYATHVAVRLRDDGGSMG